MVKRNSRKNAIRKSTKRSVKRTTKKRTTKKRSVKRTTKKRSVKRTTKKRTTKKRSVKRTTKKRSRKLKGGVKGESAFTPEEQEKMKQRWLERQSNKPPNSENVADLITNSDYTAPIPIHKKKK